MPDFITDPDQIKQLDALFSREGAGVASGMVTDPERIAHYDQLFGLGGESSLEGNSFTRGVKRGVKHLQGSANAFGAALVEGVSPDGSDLNYLGDALIDNYKFYSDEAMQIPDLVERVEDIDSFSSLGSWFASRLGEQVPNIIGFMVSGGTAGLLAKGLSKGVISQAESQVIKSILPKVMPKNLVARSQLAGGYAFSTVLEGGGIAGEQIDAGFELKPGVVLPASLIGGALETFSTVVALKAFGLGSAFTSKFMDKLKQLPLPSRMAATGALVGANETGTEFLQEINALVAREIVDENYDALGEEGRSRLLNAAAGGLAVGMTLGGVGGALPGRGGHQEQRAEEDAEFRPEVDQAAPASKEIELPEPSTIVAPSGEALLNVDPNAAMLTTEDQYIADLMARVAPPEPISSGAQLDTAVLKSDPIKVERLVNGEVETTPLSEGPIVEVADQVRENLQNNRDTSVSQEELTQLVDITDEGKSEYTKLSVIQNNRLQKLETKLEEEGDLSEREFETMEKLLALAAGEEEAGKTSLTKAEQEELDDLGRDVLNDETVRVRRDGEGAGLPRERVEQLINQFSAALPGAPAVQVVDHAETAGDAIVFNQGRGTKGLFVDRGNGPEVFIFANEAESDLDVMKTYLHEVLGHGGIRALFNEQDLKSFLKLINKDEVAADEYVARIAEGKIDVSVLAKVIAFVRKTLRKLGFNLEMTDDDIRAVLRSARREFQSKSKSFNFAQLRNAMSPKTLQALQKNNAYTLRWLEYVNLGKKGAQGYVNLQTIRGALNKVNANKQERAQVEALLAEYEKFDIANVKWETFLGDLEKLIVPLKAVQLGEDADPTDQFTDAYFNPLTGEHERTYVEHGQDQTGLYVETSRTISYHFPWDVVEGMTGYMDSEVLGLHFTEPRQFGWVLESDIKGNVRILREIQSDLAQKVITQKQCDYFEDRLMRTDNLANSLYSLFSNHAFKANELRALTEALTNFANKEDQKSKGINAFWESIWTLKSILGEMHELKRNDWNWEGVRNKAEDNLVPRNYAVEARESLMTYLIGAKRHAKGKIKLNIRVDVAGALEPVRELQPKFRERLFRESMKRAAIDGKAEVLIPNGFRLAQMEYGTLENMTKNQINMLKSYDKFFQWARKAYGNRDGARFESNGYFAIPLLPSDLGPVTILARRADGMYGDLNFDPDETTPIVTDNLSGMWDFLKVRAAKLMLTPLQIAQRYQLPEISDYLNKGVNPWWNTKMKIISGVETLVQRWNKLDKARAQNLSKAIIEITQESDDLQRRLSGKRIIEVFNKFNLDQESIEIYEQVDQEFQNLLTRLEAGVLRNEARIHLGTNPAEFLKDWQAATDVQSRSRVMFKYDMGPAVANSLTKIEKEFQEMRNRNYFPYVRFGRYTIMAQAKADMTYNGKSFKEGDSVFMYTYESRAEQLNGQKDHASALKNAKLKVTLSKLDDTEMMFSGLPPSIMTNMENVLELSEDQKENLRHLFANMSPGRSFMKHLQKRKGLEGFSEETLRAFSSYMFSAANHIARVEHYLDMTKALERLGDLRKSNDYQDSVVIQELHAYFKKHYKYIMNPGTDMAHIRALGFMWYLGGNVKSATVNLTQVPMVAYPYLAARFNNDSGAVKSIAGAMKDVAGGLRGNPKYSKFENESLTRAIQEGFIDESQVTELAGMGESHVLARIMPAHYAERAINKVSYAAGYLFHQAELFNRRVTFLAGLRMALARGDGSERAYQEAKRAVQTAQFEYAKWNRPEFMRGNKSVIFLFWQYMQHAAFLAGGGEGKGTAMRMMAMMGLAGGLQGLPLAENLLDLFDFGGTKAKEMLGMKNPKVELREELRHLLQEITDQPDLVMHGLGRYLGLGPLHVFGMLGIPVPQTDITSSLSMGRIVPGMEDMLQQTRDPEKKFARMMVEMGGPVMGIGWNFYRWATVEEPDEWKAMERTLPVALKNVSKAIRLQTRGEETNRSGASIITFEPGSPEQTAEIAAQALGFAPTRMNQKYELLAAQEEARRYWLVNRAKLLEHYSYAVIIGDREGVKDARVAIKKYNKTVPTPKLQIQGKQMSQSVKIKKSKVRDMEMNRANQKMFRPVYQNVQQAFPEVE